MRHPKASGRPIKGYAMDADAAVFHHYGMFAFNTSDPQAIDAAAEAAMRGGCETKLLRAQTGREYLVSQS